MPPLTPAQHKSLRALAAELEAAGRGARMGIVARGCAELGVSRPTLYRLLAEAGAMPRRKRRADTGERTLTPEQGIAIAGLVQTARRANGKQTLTLKQAATMAAANGMAGLADAPHPSTIARTLRERGQHPNQLKGGKATGRMRTPHPNYCWQVDASVCVLWYMPGKGKHLTPLDERQYSPRKPEKLAEIAPLRITRYIVADHCTGSFYVHYRQEPGESAAGVIDALIHAMSERGPRDPMHGVPLHLFMDKGGGNKSSLVREFCTRMGITPLYHAAGTANATGSVEVAQNLTERGFEARLKFADVYTLAQLQELADQWRRHFLATAVHSRLHATRSAAWSRITDAQLRTASLAAMQAVAHWKKETRKVSRSLTITVDTRLPGVGVQVYDLRALASAGIKPEDRVAVALNPYEAPAVTVSITLPTGEERAWTVPPMEKDAFGFDANAAIIGQEYKAQPDTATDKALKRITADAAPTEAAKAAGSQHPYSGFDAMADVKEPAALYYSPRGRDALPDTKKAEAVPLTPAQALRRLRDMAPQAFLNNAPGCRELVTARHADAVPEAALPDLAHTLLQRFAPAVLTGPGSRVIPLRAVANGGGSSGGPHAG